jgi:uncharacterized protein
VPLKLADSLVLPDTAATQTFAFLARRGAGKTYAAGKLVEELLRISAPAIVLDPVGTWYGLRIAANGKGAGLSIPVFGGEHGDIPLEPSQGDTLGRMLIERDQCAVVDVSGMRKAERKRFVADFAEALFHAAKRSRKPRMVVFEEAQLFAPQRAQGEERMLGAVEDIVRLGRNYGLGSVLISQRPQSVNKEVLNQVEVLCVGQLNAQHERKAIEDWVLERRAERGWTDELPSLPVGTMIVWSPQWLRTMQKVRIAKKNTFDASATPELGARPPKFQALVQLDVAALREALGSAQGSTAKTTLRQSPEHGALRAALQAAEGRAERAERALHNARSLLERHATELASALASLRSEGSRPAGKARQTPVRAAPGGSETFVKVAAQKRPTAPSGGSLKGPEQRILDALAWLESIGVEVPEQAAVAFLAGYTVGGGAFNNPRGRLRALGFVEYVAGERIQLTASGRGAANAPEAPLTSKALHERVLERLPGPEQRLLKPLLDAYPKPMLNDELAAAAGYTAGAGAYNNPRGRLRTLGLVEYPAPGQVRARDLLFLHVHR